MTTKTEATNEESTTETDITYPFEDQMAENNVLIEDLDEKTQNLIAKFNAESDEVIRESLDEKIFNDVSDFIEAREKKAQAAARKIQHTEFKNKKTTPHVTEKVDVSASPTANESNTPKKDATFTDRLFGRK